jgi:predicted transcriptional regulator
MIQKLNLNLIKRNFTSDNIKNLSAFKLFQQSCYHKIDFKINEDSNVQEAVIRFNAFNIGCLAVTNDTNKVIGVISERDYISKILCSYFQNIPFSG